MPVLPSTRPLVLSSRKRKGKDVLNKDPPAAVDGIRPRLSNCWAGPENANVGIFALGKTQLAVVHPGVKYGSLAVTVYPSSLDSWLAQAPPCTVFGVGTPF